MFYNAHGYNLQVGRGLCVWMGVSSGCSSVLTQFKYKLTSCVSN